MSQTNILWKVNDLSFELDAQDAETADKLDAVFKHMGENEKKLPKIGKAADIIKAYHGMFIKLYDELFGEGAGVKILGEKANTRICNEIYETFLAFISEQTKANIEFKNNIQNKYSANRAQRRAAK